MDGQQTREIATGVRGYTEGGDWGTAIYEWAGDGNGNTRAALRSLKRPITVIDPGEPGTDSYSYWQKMLGEGLVDYVQDAEDNDITASMRQHAGTDAALSREMLEMMGAAKMCGPMLQVACGAGRVRMLRAIELLVGREQLHQWLLEIDGTANGPLIAAAKGWHPETFGFLLEVLGGVPHTMSEKFPGPFQFETVPAVECRALEAALGLDGVFSQWREPFPMHQMASCTPCAPIVRMILDACPQIQPHTLLARLLRTDANTANRHESLIGWSIRTGDQPLQQMLMARDPVVYRIDLITAIECQNAPLVRSMLTRLKFLPKQALRAISGLSPELQVEALRDAPALRLQEEVTVADVMGSYAPQTYRVMCEKFGVDPQLALIGAAGSGSAEGVRELVRFGADPNGCVEEKMSGKVIGPALHDAKNGDVVRALVECGANTEAANGAGQTPLQSWLADTPTPTRVPLLVDKILRIAEGGADLAVKLEGRTLMRMAQRWPEDIRRALKSAKMGVKLGSAMDADEEDGVAPGRGSDPSPL